MVWCPLLSWALKACGDVHASTCSVWSTGVSQGCSSFPRRAAAGDMDHTMHPFPRASVEVYPNILPWDTSSPWGASAPGDSDGALAVTAPKGCNQTSANLPLFSAWKHFAPLSHACQIHGCSRSLFLILSGTFPDMKWHSSWLHRLYKHFLQTPTTPPQPSYSYCPVFAFPQCLYLSVQVCQAHCSPGQGISQVLTRFLQML